MPGIKSLKLKNHLGSFFSAWCLLTIIPVPQKAGNLINNASMTIAYCPVIGILIGLSQASSFYLANLFLPPPVSILICILTTLFITGAMHEDGLADTADALFSRKSHQEKLSIMKDSRLGTFGTSALVFLFLIKFQLLSDLIATHSILLFVAAHVLARCCLAMLASMLPDINHTNQAKKLPSHQSRGMKTVSEYAIVTTCAMLVFCLMFSISQAIIIISTLSISTFLLCSFFKYHLQGRTGDCLGATEEISQLYFYAICLAFT